MAPAKTRTANGGAVSQLLVFSMVFFQQGHGQRMGRHELPKKEETKEAKEVKDAKEAKPKSRPRVERYESGTSNSC